MAKMSERRVSKTSTYNTLARRLQLEHGAAVNSKKVWTQDESDTCLNNYFDHNSSVTHLIESGRDQKGINRRVWALVTRSNGSGKAIDYTPGPTRISRAGQLFTLQDLKVLKLSRSPTSVKFNGSVANHVANILARTFEEVVWVLTFIDGCFSSKGLLDTAELRESEEVFNARLAKTIAQIEKSNVRLQALNEKFRVWLSV